MDKRIIICDDDEGILESTALVLDNAGYEVTKLQDSTKLLDKAKEIKPALIILDLWMPLLSGEEAALLLQKDKSTKDIPIIILSAHKNTQQISENIGAIDSISKPFDIDELENKVKKYTDHIL